MPLEKPIVGRFAPSPTGPLHFGSLVSAVGSYCLARCGHGRWLVRIEDLDPPRVVAGAEDEILRTLECLGLFWDGEVVRQSRRGDAYEAALEQLDAAGWLYPCTCSRREILASAPHLGEEGAIYPGTCRAGLPAGRQPRALRMRVADEPIAFDDALYGPQRESLAASVGDFVLKRADGLYAYQLAVVVDDAASGVTEVVRGADLLSSTARQLWLYAALRLAPPSYCHLPLVLGADGDKISKRHGLAVGLNDPLGGEAVFRALAFLGQPVPRELRRAPSREVLAWGVANFSLAHIDPRHRLLPDSG